MKKVLFSCMGLLMLTATSAFAEGTAYLVTKPYVDAGLQSVYNKIKSAQNDVDELTVFVGAPTVGDVPGTGLAKRIEDLEVGLTNANNQYSGDGRGVIVTTDNKIGIIGLTQATGTNNKMYVFQNNIATELEMVDAWTIEN